MSGGEGTRQHVVLPSVCLIIWVCRTWDQAVVVAWRLVCGRPVGVLTTPPRLGGMPGTLRLLFPVNFCRQGSHVHVSYLFLRFARNPDISFPTCQRLCFLGPGLTLFLVSRVLSSPEHYGKVELCAGLGARQLCDLGPVTSSLGREIRLSAAGGHLCQRDEVLVYFWFLCLAMETR